MNEKSDTISNIQEMQESSTLNSIFNNDMLNEEQKSDEGSIQ